MAPNDVRSRFFDEPRRALLTPSASPSVGPPDRPPTKRPRFRSTPSSAISATPSTSNESTTSSDVNSARRASTLRVLNTWAQLAERYNKRLDEDDIIDLHRCVIIKDRGAVEGASREYHIGHLTLDSDQDDPDADQDQEDSEQEDDENELNALPSSETATDDDAPMSKKELLRGVPPLSATTDVEDLREFLEAEKKRRELAGDEEDDEEMSPEQRSALRKELEERLKKKEAAANQARDPPLEREVDNTPTRPSTRVPPSDDESEDELSLWTHDESTAVYPVARDELEQEVHEVEQEVIELTDSDSDEEFEALLTHPPRFNRVLPLPIPQPKQIHPPLQSPPDSEREKSKSRARSHSKIKPAEVTLKPGNRPRSPLVARKPEVILTQRRKPSVLKGSDTMTPDDGRSDQEAVGRISAAPKGKGKEISLPAEDNHREKTPKSLGIAPCGRKRKRITSSSISGSPLAQSPAEPKSTLQSHGESISQDSTTIPQLDSPKVTLDKDISNPARFEPPVAGPSRSLSSFPPASKSRLPTSSASAFRSPEPDSVQLTSHDRNYNEPPSSDPPIPVSYPYYQRYPSRSPSIFTSLHQGTPGLSHPTHPPPLDPVQTQQAHYLLAQAMHQLSCLLSATMPPYPAYESSPGQPWQQPSPHPAYSTPIHRPPSHGTRHYHTPSSGASCSGLPPSSPVRTPVSPPFEGQRARSRARSKSRGRRVSFKLDGEEAGGREHNARPELQHSAQQKHGKETHEPRQDRGKGKAIEEFDNSLRLKEGRASPPREVARGRTPGPPNRKKNR